MAASTASHRPIKGILKNKTSTTSSVVAAAEQPSKSVVDEELSKKSQKWDEMNILATYHPADKDYGLMKIDEPSTPYHRIGDDEDALSDSENTEAMTPAALAKKLAAAEGSEPKYQVHVLQESSEEEDDSDLSPEEQEKKRQFEMKRKLHYNEGLNMKLARQLISKDLHEDEDEEMFESATGESVNMEDSNQGSTTGDQLQNKSQSS